MEIASECQRASKLGFLGVDIVLDAKRGPIVLELNARPGLGIQNCNRIPLKGRLERVEGLYVDDSAKAVRIARELFGGEIGLEIERDFGKPVLGSSEDVILMGPKGKKLKVAAKVDTGAYRTSICQNLADQIKMGEPVRKKYVRSSLGGEWRDIYDLEMIVAGKKVKTQVFVSDRAALKYDAIIGRRDLKNFLVDPMASRRMRKKKKKKKKKTGKKKE